MLQKLIFQLCELLRLGLSEDWEDLQDLRQAKQEQEGEPTYSLEEVRAMLDNVSN